MKWFLLGFLVFVSGCAVEHMNLTLHNARTAGMELTETSSAVVETAVEAVN